MTDDLDHCYKAALRILRHRWNSAAQLRLKLRVRNFDKQTIDATIARLTDEHWLDDQRFAGSFARTRAGKRVGPRRIARELAAAGVNEQVAGQALEEIADEDRVRADAVALCQKRIRMLTRRHGAAFVRSAAGRNKLTVYLLNQGYDAALAREIVKETTVAEH